MSMNRCVNVHSKKKRRSGEANFGKVIRISWFKEKCPLIMAQYRYRKQTA